MNRKDCMKYLLTTLWLCLCTIAIQAQELNILPKVTPAGGSFNDKVTVTCTFPEGCTGGKYWFNGGQIAARTYTGPITLERSTSLSVAGTDAEGRIITDFVTYDYNINKVTPPYVTTSPEVNASRESFYVTQITWNNAVSTSIDVADFKEGGKRYKENVVWLVYEPTKKTIAASDYNGLWLSSTNTYKAYLYNNYRPEAEGAYTLHIAKGVFVVDGKRYDEELVLKYFVGAEDIPAPVFTPVSGTYNDKVQVSIKYPEKAFYQFYQIEGQNRKNYDGPFTVTESCTIKAWGKNEEFTEDTETSTVEYTIIPTGEHKDVLSRPTFSRSGNTVTINKPVPDAVIKYWFNNHMQNAQIYKGSFTVDHNCVISAVAYTDHAISPTVNYTISHFSDDSELGTIILTTPEDWESVTLTGMSPNGRFVSGYTDTGGSPMSFLWDITSGKGEFISTSYYSQALGVSNDGTIFGWRVEVDPTTGEAISTSDETLFYGYCQNGIWTRQPSKMTVAGISGDNILFGSYEGKPATFNIKTQEITYYATTNGSINYVNSNGTVWAGSIDVKGKQVPAYWKSVGNPVTITTDRECSVVSISGNGRWMLLDNKAWGSYCDIAGYRYDAVNNKVETLTSMGAQYPSRYEWMHSVADDGTLYGVYDASMISHDAGQALAYTTDGVWCSVADILAERDFAPDGLALLSAKLVSSDQNTYVMTVFPSDMDIEDGVKFAMAVRFDVKTDHAAPTSVKAVQMSGMKAVKVTWDAPMMGAEDVASYKLYRNGVLRDEVDSNVFEYTDKLVENDTEYTYTVVAVYNDGKESAHSFPYTLKVLIQVHTPVRELAMRQSGINDINLTWQAPVISLPKLQYFSEDSEFAAFGTANYDSEWAIRIPASDVSVYEGMDIRTFQFLPTGAQEGYELRLYTGTPNSKDYDETPFYTQTIDPASLKYGTVNTIQLTSPQEMPADADLIVALLINQSGNDNMLGVSHTGFRAGYTDLCRVVGVHKQFVSIAESSSVTTEIVIPLGVGIATEESLKAALIANYEVSDNGSVIGNTDVLSYRMEDVAEGEHNFSVRAKYQDGVFSAPTTLTADIKKNEAAFVPVSDLNVETNEAKATLTWKAPLNEDRTNIHWGDLNPSKGLEYKDYPIFAVASLYPVTMTNAYADEYEITHIFFYPTSSEATYQVLFDDNVNDVYFEDEVEVVPNQINYVALDEPVTIDRSTNYRIVIDVFNCPSGASPLAFDSSNKCMDGYSNMVNAGNEWMTLNDVLQIDQHPNWLMGMIIRQKDAREMPLQGYNVVVDGIRQNAQLLNTCTFTTGNLANGVHEATVDVVYDSKRTVKSEPVEIVIETMGIEQLNADSKSEVKYDLQGRRVISDKKGNALYIMGNKKYIAK